MAACLKLTILYLVLPARASAPPPSARLPVGPGNLHRVFLCELQNGLSHPVAVITQRDVARILLIFLGLTLQGEVGRQHRPTHQYH